MNKRKILLFSYFLVFLIIFQFYVHLSLASSDRLGVKKNRKEPSCNGKPKKTLDDKSGRDPTKLATSSSKGPTTFSTSFSSHKMPPKLRTECPKATEPTKLTKLTGPFNPVRSLKPTKLSGTIRAATPARPFGPARSTRPFNPLPNSLPSLTSGRQYKWSMTIHNTFKVLKEKYAPKESHVYKRESVLYGDRYAHYFKGHYIHKIGLQPPKPVPLLYKAFHAEYKNDRIVCTTRRARALVNELQILDSLREAKHKSIPSIALIAVEKDGEINVAYEWPNLEYRTMETVYSLSTDNYLEIMQRIDPLPVKTDLKGSSDKSPPESKKSLIKSSVGPEQLSIQNPIGSETVLIKTADAEESLVEDGTHYSFWGSDFLQASPVDTIRQNVIHREQKYAGANGENLMSTLKEYVDVAKRSRHFSNGEFGELEGIEMPRRMDYNDESLSIFSLKSVQSLLISLRSAISFLHSKNIFYNSFTPRLMFIGTDVKGPYVILLDFYNSVTAETVFADLVFYEFVFQERTEFLFEVPKGFKNWDSMEKKAFERDHLLTLNVRKYERGIDNINLGFLALRFLLMDWEIIDEVNGCMSEKCNLKGRDILSSLIKSICLKVKKEGYDISNKDLWMFIKQCWKEYVPDV